MDTLSAMVDHLPPPGRRRLLHLLWAVPLALGATFFAAVMMTLSWCGVSGCSGGGFGRISDPSLSGVLLAGVAVVVVWTSLLTVAPWHRSPQVRALTGLTVGVVTAGLAMLWGTDLFVR